MDINPLDQKYLEMLRQLAEDVKSVSKLPLSRAEQLSRVSDYIRGAASQLEMTPANLFNQLRDNTTLVGQELKELASNIFSNFSVKDVETIRQGVGAGAAGGGALVTTGAAPGALATISSTMNSVGTALGATAGSTTATVVGTLTSGAVVLAVVYILSHFLGVMSADRPVAENPPRTAGPAARNAEPGTGRAPTKSGEKYGVYLVGNEIVCGQLAEMLEMPSSDFLGWGLDSSKKVKDTGNGFKLVLGLFDTAEQTREAYGNNIVPGSMHGRPLGLGPVAKFKFDDKEHTVENATRFLH